MKTPDCLSGLVGRRGAPHHSIILGGPGTVGVCLGRNAPKPRFKRAKPKRGLWYTSCVESASRTISLLQPVTLTAMEKNYVEED